MEVQSYSMPKRSRIGLLIIITVFLIAAILSVIPGNSTLKLPAVLVVTIVGTLSALAQFTGTEVFRKLFKESPSRLHNISTEDLLKYLIEHNLVVRCAAIGRHPIYQLDKDYWTNLTLDFSRIIQD